MVTITCGNCTLTFQSHPAIHDAGVIILAKIMLTCPHCKITLEAPKYALTMMPSDQVPARESRPQLRLVGA